MFDAGEEIKDSVVTSVLVDVDVDVDVGLPFGRGKTLTRRVSISLN